MVVLISSEALHMLSICIELGVEILSRTVGASQRPQIYLLGFWAKKHNVVYITCIIYILYKLM